MGGRNTSLIFHLGGNKMCGKNKKSLSEWLNELDLLHKFVLGFGGLLVLDLIIWIFR